MANPTGAVTLNGGDIADDAARPPKLADRVNEATGTTIDAIAPDDSDLDLDPNDPLVAMFLTETVGEAEARRTFSGRDNEVAAGDDAAAPIPRTETPAPGESDVSGPTIPADAEPIEPASGQPAPESVSATGDPSQSDEGDQSPAFTPEQLAETRAWIASLTPEQAAAINDVLSGQYALIPQEQLAQYQPPQPQYQPQQFPAQYPMGAAPGQGSPSVPGPPPSPGIGNAGFAGQFAGQPTPIPQLSPEVIEDNPQLAQIILAQQQQLAQMQAQQAQFAQQQLAQQQAVIAGAVANAQQEFNTTYQLNPIELDLLTRRAVETQVVGYYRRQHADPKDAMKAALEHTYHALPEFRTRELQRMRDTEVAQDADIAERRRRAASVSGAPGSVPRTPPPDKPLTKDQRQSAMAQAIAEAMNQGSDS